MDLVDIPNSELLVTNNEHLIYSGERELLTAISVDDGSLVWKSDIYDGRALQTDELLYSREQNKIYGRHFNNIVVWSAYDGAIVYELSDSLNQISTSRINFNTLMNNGYAMVGEKTDAHILNWNGALLYSIGVPWSTASVTYDGTRLFIGQRNTVHGGLTQGRIRAFDASTGDSLWTYQTDNGGFDTRTYVQDGVVYGAAKGNSPLGEIVALDSETGQQIWVYNEKDRAQAQNLSMSEKNIIANTGGGLTAIEKTSGDLSWRVDWSGYGDKKPVYLEGYVYHARYSEILVIHDASGEIVHREPVPSGERYFWHLTAAADKLFAQTDATITAYEPWHLREE
jgi:outer membrane protein assembly factor BamB